MSNYIHGLGNLFGEIPAEDHLPTKGFPEGELTIEFHPKKFAEAKIVVSKGQAIPFTLYFFIKEENGFWIPGSVATPNPL
jgi:hypothetical protein